jgi:hypothetical protein
VSNGCSGTYNCSTCTPPNTTCMAGVCEYPDGGVP